MKIPATVGALAFSAGVASAADMPVKAPPIPIVAPFSWTGFYIGGHAGCNTDGCNKDDPPPAVSPLPPLTTAGPLLGGTFNLNGGSSGSSLKGFMGGVHAGYNYQLPNRIVVGIEGDVDYTDMQASVGGGDPATLAGQVIFNTRWQGSVRLRAGYAFERLLIYATGGLAFADGKLSTSGVFVGGVPFLNTNSTNTHVGWTAGGGAEFAFTNNWIGRAEVRYTDFQSATYAGPVRPISVSWDQVSVALGISYKF